MHRLRTAGFGCEGDFPHDRFAHGGQALALLTAAADPVSIPEEERPAASASSACVTDRSLDARVLAQRYLQPAGHVAGTSAAA